MKKVIGQTVRDLEVLHATSNEPWGPHGTLLADIAQATRNSHEYQMIMAVIWKQINDTGKNWRHVYKEEKVDSSLEFLILASDGLWDVVSNEEAAKRLMKEAYQRGSSDNITYVIVRFLSNQ